MNKKSKLNIKSTIEIIIESYKGNLMDPLCMHIKLKFKILNK